MMYYVMTTRAKRELYICHSGKEAPPILADIPTGLVVRSET